MEHVQCSRSLGYDGDDDGDDGDDDDDDAVFVSVLHY